MSRKKALNGFKWTTIANLSHYAISFALSIILARYLTPREYGITASFAIFTIFSRTLIDGGLSVALVQKKEINQGHLNSVFWFNLMMSLLLYFLVWIIAPSLSNFLREDELTPIIRIVSFIYITNALGLVQNSLLIRELNFRKQTVINILSLSISVLVALYCIYKNMGVYCIVFQILSQSIVLNLLLTISSNWRPRFSFSIKSFGELWNLGSRVLVVNLLNTIYNQLDGFFIGRVFRLNLLGIYTRGKSFTDMINSIYVNSIQTVTFSLLSESKNESSDDKFLHQHKMIFSFALFYLIIFCAIISANSENIVAILYGEKWLDSSFYLSWLVFGLIPVFISTMSSQSLLAKGEGKVYLKLFLFRKTPIFISFFVGYYYGLTSFVIFGVIFNILLVTIDFYFLSSFLKIPIYYYLKKTLLFLVFIPVLFAVSLIVRQLIPNEMYLELLITVLTQVAFLVLILELLKIKEYGEMKKILFKKLSFDKNIN